MNVSDVVELHEPVNVFDNDPSKKKRRWLIALLVVIFVIVFVSWMILSRPSKDLVTEEPIVISAEDLLSGNLPSDLFILDCSVHCPTLAIEYTCEHLKVLTEGQIAALKKDSCQVLIKVESTGRSYIVR